jgi:hypothetical protein
MAPGDRDRVDDLGAQLIGHGAQLLAAQSLEVVRGLDLVELGGLRLVGHASLALPALVICP